MTGKRTTHRLSKVDPRARQAVCVIDGPVGIKSAGSDGRGGTRWRCAAQVIRSKRTRAQQQRAERLQAAARVRDQRYSLDVALPCCQTLEHIDAPSSDDRDAQGDLLQLWVARCPACSESYSIEVLISDEKNHEGVSHVVSYVKYVIAEQVYIDGRLDGHTRTARIIYTEAESAWDEEHQAG